MDPTYPEPHYDWLQKWQPDIGRALEVATHISDAGMSNDAIADWLATEFVQGKFDEVFKNEVHCMLDYKKWGQQIFCMPKIMQEKMDATDVSRIGLEELRKMPFPCFYVNLRKCGWNLWSLYDECYYPISGFYVLRDNTDPDVDTLLFFIHAEGKDGEFGSKYFFKLNLVNCFRDHDCVGDYVSFVCGNPERDASSPGVSLADDKHVQNSETFMHVYRLFAAMLMYLQTQDPSLRKDDGPDEERRRWKNKLKNCKKPNSKKAKRYKTMLGRVSGRNVTYLGEREEREITSRPGFVWEKKRRWRRGHDHRFWTGSKKYPEGHLQSGDWIPYELWENASYNGNPLRILVTRWVKPVICNPDAEPAYEGAHEYGFTLECEQKHKLLRKYMFKEGKAKDVKLTKYERCPRARAACLEHYGCVCQVCDYEPGKDHKLGSLVSKFIQVHHVNPIHTKNGEEHPVDHVEDLIPVCYECHKYIHSRGTKKKPYSISELRDLIDYLARDFQIQQQEEAAPPPS